MAEEDIFGQPLAEDDTEDFPVDEDEEDTEELSGEGSEDDDGEAVEDVLADAGDVPADAAAAQKHWQAAFTRARQKDRTDQGTLRSEHAQYKQVLDRFYKDDAYAQSIIAQRFPQGGNAAQAGSTTSSQAGQSSDITAELERGFGEFGFLAQSLGPTLQKVIDGQVESRVKARLDPIEARATQQTTTQRHTEESRQMAALDAQHPGWEEKIGTKMADLDAYLASDALTHPEFGDKYTLIHRLLAPDAVRVTVAREMGDAARKRTRLGRSGRSVPNIVKQVRNPEISNTDAFWIAAKAASEDTPER